MEISDIECGSPRYEQVIDGIGVAPGIAIGPVYLFARDAYAVVHRPIEQSQVEAEVQRFERAVLRSERELQKIASVAREKLGDSSASIFEAQSLMLRDDALYLAVIERIREELCSADYAVQSVMSRHRQQMKASDSEYLRERANDLLDVQDRIIRRLRRGKILSAIDQGTIVVSENLTAADVILFSRRNILGCALDHGGATSHVSIMARALNLPTVVSMHGITGAVKEGDIIALDGLHGRVIINPSQETLAQCRAQQKQYRRFLREQKRLSPLPADTLDRRHITLRANLEFEEELKLIEEYGAEGVGLFRTEILFLMRGQLSFSEEDQLEIYKRIVEVVSPAATTFRVLDLGGDKMLPLAHREQNPFLGWRGIRVLLDKADLIVPQIRALLRASAYGPVRILAPMITMLDEVRRFKQIIEEVKQDLRERKIAFDESVEIGIMVEVPAVAIMAEQFAKEVDFFSIGSNDLTQYTLAVDRGNDLVSDKYQELHPAVLRLIKHAIEAGHKHNISVSLCGELGANPRATPILVGLQIDEISVSPSYLPEVKRVVRAMKQADTEDLIQKALSARDAGEVEKIVDAWLMQHDCDITQFLEAKVIKLVTPMETHNLVKQPTV